MTEKGSLATSFTIFSPTAIMLWSDFFRPGSSSRKRRFPSFLPRAMFLLEQGINLEIPEAVAMMGLEKNWM
ncbi:hypothetical protein P8C59_007512 [Phyllachora maydis]|uniref:Uncharacterized protein n=1 Tax=Phyllachora maydis TaxID=1825666 RepID=A0AAD9MID8_9PEZI|nr:hypothetical protein P8C59_007512 [Phyllachora maydis]